MVKINPSYLDSKRQFLTFRGAKVDEMEYFKRISSEPGFVAQLTNLSDYEDLCWITICQQLGLPH